MTVSTGFHNAGRKRQKATKINNPGFSKAGQFLKAVVLKLRENNLMFFNGKILRQSERYPLVHDIF